MTADIRLKEYGSEILEVTDNGSGVEESNFQGLSKFCSFCLSVITLFDLGLDFRAYSNQFILILSISGKSESRKVPLERCEVLLHTDWRGKMLLKIKGKCFVRFCMAAHFVEVRKSTYCAFQ